MREDLKEWNEEDKKLRESWKGTIWEWVTDTPAIYEIAKTWYCPQRETNSDPISKDKDKDKVFQRYIETHMER